MRKTLIIIPWLILGALVALQMFYFLATANQNGECPFCTPEKLDRQQYYEGQRVRALVNYKPIVPGHSLIIPKRDVPQFQDLTSQEMEEMREVINKVQMAFQKVYGSSDYLMVLQNGPLAGQTVSHLHFHLLPRPEKNGLKKIYLWWLMLMRPFYSWRNPDWDALEEQRHQLQEAMKEADYERSASSAKPRRSVRSRLMQCGTIVDLTQVG